MCPIGTTILIVLALIVGVVLFRKQHCQSTKILCHNSSLKGKNVVISGCLFYFQNHNELKTKLEFLGANVYSRVSCKTDILIVGESATFGMVQDVKAMELGVCILRESEILPYL